MLLPKIAPNLTFPTRGVKIDALIFHESYRKGRINMRTDLLTYYRQARERLLAQCVCCGKCVANCRAYPWIPSPPDPREAQRGILAYLRGAPQLSDPARRKIAACMRCYGCADIRCPAGVDSLLINELVLREGELRKEKPFDLENYPVQDALARRFTTPEEYARITTPVLRPDADTLFFPGCNVYKQPEKLLAALDLLDATSRPYSFVPGLSHCCGQMPQAGRGGAEYLQQKADTLIDVIQKSGAKTVVFWCPTCLVTLSARIEKYRALPFEPRSFAAYLLRYADRLHFSCAQPKTVTLHDPCKAVYMGLEQESVRKLLSLVPGTRLVEMAHHGKDALCCGCASVGAVTGTQMDVGDRVTEARVQEARDSGADTLISVCHNCHLVFARYNAAHPDHPMPVENYACYLLAAMGKLREDTAPAQALLPGTP